MAAKRKVSQDDLRKMMQDMKSNKTASTSSSTKKLKLSSRELALIEEEKRQKAVRDQEKIRLKQEKMARIVPNQGLQPKKSILKNSAPTSNYIPPQYHVIQDQSKKSQHVSIQEEKASPKETVKTIITDDDNEEEASSSLPEGFFDDPKLDAKARNVQYVDQEEEEWSKFQKEIAEEVVTAQEILVEDRNEATADRQLEDIDEQMQAWKRVAQLEEKKEAVVRNSKSKDDTTKDSDEEDESDLELDDLTDWRKKK